MCFSLLPSAYSLFLGSFGEEGVYVAFESFDALDTHIRFVDTIVGVQKDGCGCGPQIERTGCFPPVDKHGVGDVGAIDETLDLLDVVVEPHPDDGDIFVLIVKVVDYADEVLKKIISIVIFVKHVFHKV